MRAIQVTEPGGPDVMKWVELPTPNPGRGEVLVRVEAAGVNFIDVYFRKGVYAQELPAVMGLEGAGVVEACGPEVSLLKEGDRVAFCERPGASSRGGTYATHAVVAERRAVPIPRDVSSVVAAASMLQGMTAHYLSHSTFPLSRGQTCLVHAAAGGVGLLLCQMAKMRGARVIGTVSTEEKASLARGAGADHTILYGSLDFVVEVQSLTENRGVDVVYDSVGKTTFDGSLAALTSRGMLVLYGQSSGAVPPFDPQVLNAKGSLFLTRPSLGHYVRTRDELLGRTNDVFSWVQQGKLDVRVGATFSMDRAADAHRALEGRATTGKVILVP